MSDSSSRRVPALVLLLAAVAAVLAAGLGGVASHRSVAALRSTALLSIDEPKALAASQDGGVIEKLSRVRLKYLGLVTTDKIAVPVAASLSQPVDQVRGQISGLALPTDLLMRVTCTGPKARQCANALAQALIDYAAQEQASSAIPVAQRVILTQVQQAGGAYRPARGRYRTAGVAALAGALAAGLVLALAARQRR